MTISSRDIAADAERITARNGHLVADDLMADASDDHVLGLAKATGRLLVRQVGVAKARHAIEYVSMRRRQPIRRRPIRRGEGPGDRGLSAIDIAIYGAPE